MQKEKKIVDNHRKSENLVIIFLAFAYLILSGITNIFLIISAIPYIIIGLYIVCLIFLTGLKLLKIESVSKSKIYIYMLSMLILDLSFNFLFHYTFFELFSNNIFIFHIVDFITYSIFTVIFLKYYFLFSIRKTLQLFLYLTILSFILIILTNKLLFF